MPRISHSHESYQSKPPRSKWGTVLARYDRTGALIAWQVRAYRNFCGAYNRGPALWEQACRPVIFVAWKMMRPRWWAGWRENAIQQSEEMPRVRACDEEERADRQGRPAVEMPGLPVELDDAAAAAQAGADAGGVPFLAAGAVIPKGGGLRGRRPRPAQTNRMVLAHPPAHRPAGRQAPHGHGGRHVHGCLCSISCCGFSHDDFSGLGRACRPRNGLNWMVLVSPPERTGKDYDQHAPSTVYPSFAAERGIRRVDRAENTCQRADGA